LLNTPIIGMPTAIVDSSWIDIDAGLEKLGICRIPPGVWAMATWAMASAGAPAPSAGRNFHVTPSVEPLAATSYWSSHTSSMRAPLKMLLTMILKSLTYGCQQVARRS
jgi:hypothetical protein